MNIRESKDLGLRWLFQEDVVVGDTVLPTAHVGRTGSIPLTCTIPSMVTPFETETETQAAICAYSTLNFEEKHTLAQSAKEDGESALHWAAKQGNDVLLDGFLTEFKRIGINESEYLKSALVCAAQNGQENCVKLLIAKIEQLAISDLDKMHLLRNENALIDSAFYHAASNGHIGCMQLLLQASDKLLVPVEEKVKWFVDKSASQGAFHSSILRNIKKAEVISLVLESIDKLAISHDEKIALAISKDYYGASVFHRELCRFLTPTPFAQNYLTALMKMKIADNEKMAVFTASYHENDATPMHVAANKGRADCVLELIAAIEKMNISSQEKLRLLEAKDKYGIPALDIAVKNGHTECVALLISAMCRQQISEEQRAQLNKIKDYHDKSMAFWMKVDSNLAMHAINEGYGKGMTFVQCFAAMAANFTEEQQTALLFELQKPNESDFSFVNKLFSSFFMRYVNYVNELQVSDIEKQRLLEAKDCFDAPALFWLAHSCTTLYQEDCANCLIDSISALAIPDQEKSALLEARGKYNTCALALSEIGTFPSDIAAVLYSAIERLTISNAQKLALFAAKNSEGSPALYEAVENEHKGSERNKFSTVIRNIYELDISEIEKSILLEAKNHLGVPVLHRLAKQGYVNQLEALVDAIFALDISAQEKINLLEGKNSDGFSALNAAAQYQADEEENKGKGQECIEMLTDAIAELRVESFAN